MNSGVEPQKKGSLLQNLQKKKQFLLPNSGVTTSILKVSGLELHSSGTEPVTFFGAQSSLGGHDSLLGGHSPECLPRGAGFGDVHFLVFTYRRKKTMC